jgi:hypothetical protein
VTLPSLAVSVDPSPDLCGNVCGKFCEDEETYFGEDGLKYAASFKTLSDRQWDVRRLFAEAADHVHCEYP